MKLQIQRMYTLSWLLTALRCQNGLDSRQPSHNIESSKISTVKSYISQICDPKTLYKGPNRSFSHSPPFEGKHKKGNFVLN